MPAPYNLEYYRGDLLEFYLVPKNSDGTPLELAVGIVPQFIIATQRGDNPPAPQGYPATVACSATVVDNRTKIKCQVTNAQGLQLKAGTPYVYDVSVNNGGEVTTYLTGNFNVTERVVAP